MDYLVTYQVQDFLLEYYQLDVYLHLVEILYQKPNKPKSMDNARWTALQNVNAALLAVGQLSSDGTRFVLNAKKLNAQGGLHTLSTRLTELAAQTTAAPLPFTASDWVNNAGKAVQLSDLVVYNNSAIVAALNPAKKSAYQLKR
jgi:hypothetical protein